MTLAYVSLLIISTVFIKPPHKRDFSDASSSKTCISEHHCESLIVQSLESLEQNVPASNSSISKIPEVAIAPETPTPNEISAVPEPQQLRQTAVNRLVYLLAESETVLERGS